MNSQRGCAGLDSKRVITKLPKYQLSRKPVLKKFTMIDSSMFSFAYVRNMFRQLRKKPAMALQKGKLIHYLKRGRDWCINKQVFYGICFLVMRTQIMSSLLVKHRLRNNYYLVYYNLETDTWKYNLTYHQYYP